MQVSDELKDYLKSASFAVLCVSVDLGRGEEAVLVVKSSSDVLAGLREAQAGVGIGWVVEKTPRGPALCLVFRAEGTGVGDLVGETYFDAADPADLKLLRLLGIQERLEVVFLDEAVNVSWVAEMPWDEIRRLEAQQVLDRAEEWMERTRAYDFEAAKELFQTAKDIDRLVALAFPGAA